MTEDENEMQWHDRGNDILWASEDQCRASISTDGVIRPIQKNGDICLALLEPFRIVEQVVIKDGNMKLMERIPVQIKENRRGIAISDCNEILAGDKILTNQHQQWWKHSATYGGKTGRVSPVRYSEILCVMREDSMRLVGSKMIVKVEEREKIGKIWLPEDSHLRTRQMTSEGVARHVIGTVMETGPLATTKVGSRVVFNDVINERLGGHHIVRDDKDHVIAVLE
jgi:hypothetical protein